MADTSSNAIDVVNAVKRYGDFTALKEISLSIADNEFFTLLGPSGCGKTTLLRMIAGFEDVTEGDILLYGIDFPTPTQGWIAGEFGVILTTADAGLTWTAQQSPVETTLFSVAFADTMRGWAVGIEEVLIHTEDGGLTWERQRVPPRKGFVLGIYNVDVEGDLGWAIGDSGLELPIELAAGWFRGIHLDSNGNGLIVGGNGVMIATSGEQFRKLGQKARTGHSEATDK